MTSSFLRLAPLSARAVAVCLSTVVAALVLVSGASAQTSPAPRAGGEPACSRLYGRADADCPPVAVPANGYATNVSYGRGWDCSFGFRAEGEGCTAIVVPANAHLDSYGERWTCDRGFRSVDGACRAIPVPANGYLSDYQLGDGWECERGYRQVSRDCVAIQVPPNAYLVSSSIGPGWRCDRGYRIADASCAKVAVPENAHLDYAGDGWDCNRPYLRAGALCELR